MVCFQIAPIKLYRGTYDYKSGDAGENLGICSDDGKTLFRQNDCNYSGRGHKEYFDEGWETYRNMKGKMVEDIKKHIERHKTEDPLAKPADVEQKFWKEFRVGPAGVDGLKTYKKTYKDVLGTTRGLKSRRSLAKDMAKDARLRSG